MINAERPLALMFMAISPFASPRLTKETAAVATPGQKKGIFARGRQNRGNPPKRSGPVDRRRRDLASRRAGVGRDDAFGAPRERCYEPEIMGVAADDLSAPTSVARPDHDSVIGVVDSNKLKS